MGRQWLVSLAVLLAGVFQAQAGEISGRVLDSETGNRIRDVNVRLLETGEVVSTTKKGTYEFTGIPDGRYHLVATHVKYDRTDTLVVEVDTTGYLDIYMHPEPWVLNGVVVTGTRSPHLLKNVPVQTEVITQRDFQRTGARTVDEALNYSIGIAVNDDLSGRGATIRGIEGDRVLVLVDGERAVGRVRGSIDLSQFALNNVEKIEVVKGTGSTLYGSEAMGGVINIITKKPKYDALKGNLYVDYGSHTSYNPSAELEYGNDKNAFTFGAKLYSTDGFDLDKTTSHTNGQEKTSRWNLSGKYRGKLSRRWSLTSSARYMSEQRAWIEEEARKLNNNGDSLFKSFDDDERNKRIEGSVRLDFLSGDKYSMYIRQFATYYKHDWDKFDTVGFWVDTSRTEDYFVETAYHSNYVIGQNHVITFGGTYSVQDLKSSELASNAEAQRTASAYLQYEYEIGDKWNLLPGVRYEHISSFGSFANPSLNIMYNATGGLKLRGFVGYGFRAPSMKQQYFIFDHSAAGYIVVGDQAPLPADAPTNTVDKLQPLEVERSINSSISAEVSYGTIGLHRITYFYNHLNDLIDFQLLGFTPAYWRGMYVYQNVGTAITRGIEWESRVRLGKAVDFSVSYDYLYTRNLDEGRELVNRPHHTLKFFVTGLLDSKGIGGSIWGSYQSRKLWVPRSNTGGNEGGPDEYAPPRTTINASLFKRIPMGPELFLRVENIFDETNVTYGYWPGRQVYAGVKYTVN